MSEHTTQILRRFSAREWERAELLGFDLPEFGRVAIATDRAKREKAYVAGYSRPRVACILTRGAIRLRTLSIRAAAARLHVSQCVVRQRMNVGATVNGWRVRRAA